MPLSGFVSPRDCCDGCTIARQQFRRNYPADKPTPHGGGGADGEWDSGEMLEAVFRINDYPQIGTARIKGSK
jgi:hypothetical protein